MARRNVSEFAGTEPDASNGGGPIDPTSLINDGTTGTDGEYDPAIHVGPNERNGDGSLKRKRGRKAGTKSAPKKAGDLKGSIDALSNTIVMLHTGLAGVTKIPELVLDKTEGDLLAQATANVIDQFDLTPDPKIQAIFGLIVAAGMVYGPRTVVYKERLRIEARARKAKADQENTLNMMG